VNLKLVFLRNSKIADHHFNNLSDTTAFRKLRDTAIIQAMASGAAVLAISRIAGHANPSITLNVYSHVLKESMGSIQRALDESYADLNSDRYVTDENLLTA